MLNIKRLLKPNPYIIKINKAESELLQYFISNKTAFDKWYAENEKQYPKIRFTFYYPTAIDFYFNEFKLFTAYFKKASKGKADPKIATQLLEEKLK